MGAHGVQPPGGVVLAVPPPAAPLQDGGPGRLRHVGHAHLVRGQVTCPCGPTVCHFTLQLMSLRLDLVPLKQCSGSGWIRIQIAAWTRIRIRYTDPDPASQI